MKTDDEIAAEEKADLDKFEVCYQAFLISTFIGLLDYLSIHSQLY